MMALRSLIGTVTLSLMCAVVVGAGPGAAQSSGDSFAAPAPAARCGTLDREARELLYGFPFDPSDCSATETNPSPDYDPGALYEIPVVVHIIMDDSCSQGVISDDLVHSQIEILNEDFLALPGTNGENGTDAQIQFVLASEDPDGNPTEGITRDCNTTWFNDNGAYWNELAWDPHNYLNIYTNLASGALGYVPFLPADGGGGQVGQPHDRVVVLWEAFGRDAPIGPPYDQGRTATHEVGHFLGLEHTFTPQGQCGSADPPACYGDGDLICDTEVEQSPRFGCPVGAQSCGSIDPIENYMDYSDDLCMELFTLEQMRRNRCTLQFYRPDLFNEVTQLPELAFDPVALEFGDVEVGTTSPPQATTLSNTGDVDATEVVFSGLPDAGFEVASSDCGDTLPTGGSCTVSVTFTPAAPGPATATLHVASDEDATADLGLSGNGIGGGGGPIADITPESFTFEVPAGGSDSDTLNIGNVGDADLDWSLDEAEGAPALLEEWSDNFDSYETGSQLHGQGGWKGWLNDPAAGALVSDAQAQSAPNSAEIVGASDLVHEYVDSTSGQWTYTAWQYVPTDFTGISMFIMLNTYNDGGSGLNWSTQVELHADTDQVVNAGVSGGTLPLVRGEWVELRVEIDLDADTQEFFYGGELLYSGTWTGEVSGGGALNIGVVDLFANGATPVYYDDMSLSAAGGPGGGCAEPTDVPWLAADPTTGTTPPSDSVPVGVTVDAAALEPGDYAAQLCVTTNDPNAPLVEVPVSLTVTGGGEDPVIDVDPDSLGSTLPEGGTETQPLTISNLGGGSLEWAVTEEGPPTAKVVRLTGEARKANRQPRTLRAPAKVPGYVSRPVAEAGRMVSYPFPEPRLDLVTITHSESLDISSEDTAACVVETNSTADNQFLRTFTLTDFGITEAFDVTEVVFGISLLDTTATITVNLYTLEGEFIYDNLTLIGSAAVELSPQELTLVTVPVTGTAPAGSILVVEIVAPDLTGVGNYFPGANSQGETAPSYIASDSCGDHDPVRFADIGWPNVRLVMTVTGETGTGGGGECELPDWVSVDPPSGSVPAGESQIADVTFDATGLEPGDYSANLCLASNDPATPLVEIPLSLTVTGGGGPVADISPTSFSFEVPQGESAGDTLNVGNIGDADLTWSIEEAEPIVVPEGAPYRYGLAKTPAFHAPVGFDRASGITRSRGAAPATPIVPPAPQELALGDFSEGFDDITQLPGAGWALINNSEPLGPSSWFQGNETIFPAHEGEPDAYIAANFESTDDVGTISNWLITPEVTIVNGTTITFWTRKAELFGEFADRMEVRMSIAGDSTDVGDTAESVGDFTEVLLTINPDLIPGEYPQEWTQFTLTVRERSREPVTGRFAFRYWVTDAGPDGTNADYIGIDTMSVKQPDGEPPTGGCDDPLDIPWLAANPTSGTTAPGASVPVDVTVDTTDLDLGDYSALLCVTTNDPNAPQVKVPVDLTVIGGGGDPVIDVDPDSLSSTVPPDGTETQPLTIANLGDGTLDWAVTEDGVRTGRLAAGTGQPVPGGTATRDERSVLRSATRSAVDAGNRAAVDLVSMLGESLPSVRVVDPANGVVDCEGEPGIIIHDDGTIENAYTGDPGSVSEVRFVDLFTPTAYPATFSSVCLAFISLDPPSLAFEIVVFDDDGTDGAPGTELGSLAVTADGIPSEPGAPTWFSYDISSLGIVVEEGSVYIGARWSPETAGLVLIGADESTGNPPGFAGGHWWENNSAVWAPIEIEFTEYRSLMVRAVEAPVVGGDCELPTWVSVDPTSGSVPAGGSHVVDVTFDATGLAPGDYEANLCIASNDPVTPLVTVPLSLTVTPGGELTCFVAELDGDQEVPPVPTSATGHGDFTYDFDTMELTWDISHTLDLADVVAAHLHVAPPGEDGPVDIPLDHTINPIVGSTTLTAQQETNLTSGLYYVNIHTPSYPDGEIRGQILECEPQAGGSLTTLFASNNGFAGNTFDLAPAVPLEITGFDVNVVSAIDETITIYWKEGTAEGFDSDPSAWTVLGSDTVTPAGLDQPTHVEVGGLQLEAGEVYGFYVDLESYEFGVSTLHYTDGPPTEFSNDDLTLTTLVGKAAPAFEGTTFPDRMWNGTVYYDFSGAPATRSLEVGSSR